MNIIACAPAPRKSMVSVPQNQVHAHANKIKAVIQTEHYTVLLLFPWSITYNIAQHKPSTSFYFERSDRKVYQSRVFLEADMRNAVNPQ